MLDASLLATEYYTFIKEAKSGRTNGQVRARLLSMLVEDGDWTPKAASSLIYLAQTYGAFMLRNALALAVVMGVEDGEAGY